MKEPSGLLRTDGKRPDGATLIPWSAGRYMAWDATVVHTFAASYLSQTAISAGSATEQAAVHKTAKYALLPATHVFVPIAFETLWTVNAEGAEFLSELERRISFICLRISTRKKFPPAAPFHLCAAPQCHRIQGYIS